ncbi:MAG TPA: class I SAM-dependent methyltransferase, partial [Candidatus Paceibacterota bacterium]
MEYGVVTGKLPWTAEDRISLKPLCYRDIFNLPRIDGLIVEFGVGSGATLRTFAGMIGDHKIYGFDWFQGLPEDWNATFTKGSLANPGYASAQWPANSELVVGLIQDTLVGFLDTHPEPIAYAHLDFDLYSSTKFVLDHVRDRLGPGTILHFDEIKNINGCGHEIRAFNEY